MMGYERCIFMEHLVKKATTRVILTLPLGKTFRPSFLLNFQCNNNISKYEALIRGLNIFKFHKIKLLLVFGDSILIIYQTRD